jgi:hypothetical protein
MGMVDNLKSAETPHTLPEEPAPGSVQEVKTIDVERIKRAALIIVDNSEDEISKIGELISETLQAKGLITDKEVAVIKGNETQQLALKDPHEPYHVAIIGSKADVQKEKGKIDVIQGPTYKITEDLLSDRLAPCQISVILPADETEVKRVYSELGKDEDGKTDPRLASYHGLGKSNDLTKITTGPLMETIKGTLLMRQ